MRFRDIDWMINYQLGRRNITPEQQSYLRGVQYEREKSKVTNSSGKNQYNEVKGNSYPQPNTAEKLATQHKVAAKTIKNDAQYARAVNVIDKAAGNGAKTALLSRDTKVSKQDAVRLGAIAVDKDSPSIREISEEDVCGSRETRSLLMVNFEDCYYFYTKKAPTG